MTCLTTALRVALTLAVLAAAVIVAGNFLPSDAPLLAR